MLKEYETISLEEVNSVAILKLNRPEKLNAFNMQMLEDMLNAIDLTNSDDNIFIRDWDRWDPALRPSANMVQNELKNILT